MQHNYEKTPPCIAEVNLCGADKPWIGYADPV